MTRDTGMTKPTFASEVEKILQKLVSDITIAGYGKEDEPNSLITKSDTQPFAGYKFHQAEALAKIVALHEQGVKAAEIRAVDGELETLSEALPYFEFCERDSDRLLIWVKNHRWSLIAPPGKNTAAEGKHE